METVVNMKRRSTRGHELPEIRTASISFNDRSFLRDGKEYFIASGEMHYFRVDPDRWPVHLKRMKEAGLNTVSTYIPWSLHEQTEGQPDFCGRYGARLDLERFIGLCGQMGLSLTVKPGPYILAELAMHGIPRWFFERYPQALARDAAGKPYPVRCTCLAHPDYRRKAMEWYDAVMPLLSAAQLTHGGPVCLMQVCNEVGLFQWLAGAGDYSDASLKDYRGYLQSIYGTIGRFNALCGTRWSDWDQVRPPSGQAVSPADRLGYRDWHAWHRRFYADYIGWLIAEIRRRGISIPLFHNVPGWVFGRAKEMPVCLSMYHELSRLYPQLLLGVDHIPENPSYRNFHDDRIVNALVKALQNGRGPTYIAELQAGTREACVRVYPAEMELFYKACLANGTVAMNYYMFSQGRNPPGWSIYDSFFYLQTPLDHEGTPGDLYPAVRRIGRLVQTHGENLCRAETRASQALAFYPPYYYRELTRPLFTKENFDPLPETRRRLDPQTITDELLFDGVGKLLAMDNQEYDAVDITCGNLEELRRYRQLWLASTDRMDAASQGTLLRYVQDGGHLICFPTLPSLDLEGRPCALLARGLGVETDGVLEDTDGMVRWEDSGEEIHAGASIEIFRVDGGQIIARTADGRPCGIRVRCQKGLASVLGTGFTYQAPAHRKAWQKLGLPVDFRGPIRADNPLILTRTRWIDDRSGFLFMLNYHNQPQQTQLEAPAALGAGGRFYLPPCGGLMLPFNLPLGGGSRLIFSTSEILKIETHDGELTLEIGGHPQTEGRMTLECGGLPERIGLDGKPIPWEKEGQTVLLRYAHRQPSQKLVFQMKGLSQ